ncbi:MAG: hypothetical protein MSQ68_04440 [Trueperella pyogenes]|nr:hypothetical protein [Trueperella pyogenes]MCI7689606.1 hypothetical protein [Trueperella pyogenes]
MIGHATSHDLAVGYPLLLARTRGVGEAVLDDVKKKRTGRKHMYHTASLVAHHPGWPGG